MAAPNNTSKGVIRDIDPTLDQDELTRLIVQPRNPTVPEYVKCGPSLVKCSLYRRQTDICYACGRLGHRADVLPISGGRDMPRLWHQQDRTISTTAPRNVRFAGVITLTASRDCKRRFQVPYVVTARRRARRYQKSQEAHDSTGAEPLPPKSATSRRSRSSETRGNRIRVLAEDNSPSRAGLPLRTRGDPSPGAGRATNQTLEPAEQGTGPTWADRVKGQTKKVTGGTPPEHSNTRVAQLEKENALLKREMQQLRAEIAELRNATKHNPVQPPAPLQYVEDEAPMEVPVEEASSERPAKKRAIVDSACSSSAMKAKSEIKDAIESLSITVGAIKATLDGLVEDSGCISRHLLRPASLQP
ncbi:hypothetical protein HPB52_018043 [Rhipicephalus sanguineus]|uniref:Uncharacterized protein n=1 Tax=Rhipicephalus sanguineus TaxID=34632 RepID=A0A9D4PP09_RHISA|nr:hypothetical protein HPB52_018043 [Rhipicephalus sanguineus]